MNSLQAARGRGHSGVGRAVGQRNLPPAAVTNCPRARRDCGFATFATSATVDPQVTWAKLAAMAEGSRLASQALWA